ncbi:MAG: hypothetical protein ACXU93_07950 [Thermodesulfobacteriota bacterium]
MEKDFLNILVFGHTTFGTRHMKIGKETFKIILYLLAFLQLSITFFLCDYVQVKKRQLDLNHLQQESQIQKVEIQFLTTKIKEVEKKLAKLKVIDQRIRAIANLERNQEITPFIGMGGASSSAIPEKLKKEK